MIQVLLLQEPLLLLGPGHCFRDQVIKDFDMAQAESEQELWRQGLQTSVSAPGSRIAWGYDAQSEAAMRRSTINDLPIDRVQPATVISVRF